MKRETDKLQKRVEELERRVKELEAAPREQHNHYHYPSFQYIPQPVYPLYPSWQPYVPPPTTTITWGAGTGVGAGNGTWTVKADPSWQTSLTSGEWGHASG